jgi:hypothetical protein
MFNSQLEAAKFEGKCQNTQHAFGSKLCTLLSTRIAASPALLSNC